MKTKILRYPARPVPHGRPVIATLGNFDGVHRGHAALLQRMQTRNAELYGGKASLAVVCFYPHPATVIGAKKELPAITSLRQKTALLGEHGIELFYLIHFTPQFSKVRAAEFLDSIVCGALDVSLLVIGPDARIGYQREGDAAFMQGELARRGRRCEVAEFVSDETDRISSRRIRGLISEGNVRSAAALLGRPWALEGRVQHGAGRGSQLGFATANMVLRGQILPRFGVYATWAVLEGKRLASVTNVGVRPTFGGVTPTVETHIINFPAKPLYSEHLEVEFIEQLRDEKKFASKDDLVKQITHDIESARATLGP